MDEKQAECGVCITLGCFFHFHTEKGSPNSAKNLGLKPNLHKELEGLHISFHLGNNKNTLLR